ncbi:putative ferric-chelate reductase (NADH) [Medicago truncatula]|uniref:ferric-chelate reductase (NADH) n=1 Tax=Medicago truncatula TaxID=3880 RepID=Q2HST1_MEDTR|nr:ferric reduction oxidase 7, chloroplastic [Medicago truncatula]ABD32912.1 Ferric reductase-like transmembrane component [Medicago truncatula]AES64681.1 oxidoreductase/ferric-chelate reductase [Medicago truncatula]RHN72781.1 putative ferric-chelate reductase (NADH) [Medicago truncatula]
MEKNSVDYSPLLSKQGDETDGYVKKISPNFVVSATKWTLRTLISIIFIIWAAFIFLLPSESVHGLFSKWLNFSSETSFGITGSILLILSAPVLAIAFLAIAYLIISGEDQLPEKKNSKYPRFRLWTFPILINGPFGVVSATELIGIVIFLAYVIWAFYAYTMQALAAMSDQLSFRAKSLHMLEILGLRSGGIGLMCLAFLFIPISRGSVLLRFIDIPFEHAAKYHVWLGHLTMVIFTLHGLFYVIEWLMEGHLIQELLEWKDIGVANLAGVISLVAGLLMWVTSLPGVRTWNFELFFYTHQLYIIFIVFMALHIGDFIFAMAAGPIFLFVLDRFLRFCQSRKTVNVISSRCLPCGTVEMVLSKPQNLRYNALSFIFLQVRELSWLQWHPFSVSSSPLDGKNHIAVLIKVLGKWTGGLRERITDGDATEDLSVPPHMVVTASVEGPYGHEVPYHLMYENLILVAGGIGLSPFLAILSDILHRVREGKPCRPRNILIVWAVKKSNELPLLSTVDMETICPCFSDKVNINVHIFVTRESDPPLEEGYNYKPIKSLCPFPMPSDYGMSGLVGTGNNFWSGLYVISSTLGFVILLALLNIYYINPVGVVIWWYKGLLLVVCMVASVVIFGGIVVGFWNMWEKQSSLKDKSNNIKVDKIEQNGSVDHKDLTQYNIAKLTTIRYGSRPDFKEIFESMSEKWGHVDVGILVCGPPTLQSSVAQEIRSHSLTRQPYHPIFHFHSHSFDL